MHPTARLRGTLALAVLAAAGAAACSDATAPAPLRIELSADSLALAAGHAEALVAVARHGDGPALANVAVDWRSSAPAVADVDANGVVRALTAGKATITATVDTLSVSIPVRVYQRAEALVLPTTASLYFGDTTTLALAATDGAGAPTTPDSITWTSSDTLVATVDENGKVTVVGWGTAVVTAARGSVTAQTALTTRVGQLAAPTDFVAISGMSFSGHECALTAAGAAYCYGSGNTWGELGNGTRAPPSSGWGAVAGGHVFVDVQAGQEQTCGLTAASELYCWGSNANGSIGQDTVDRSTSTSYLFLSPTLVAGGHSWKQFSVGAHKAVCAVTTSDAPYCWGHNDVYQVGRAPTSPTDPYVLPPSGGLAYKRVGEGPFGGCGITPAGATYCWGVSALFTASGTNDAAPHLLPDLPPLISVSTGASAACGLTAAGKAYCWGNTYGGALGGGTFPDPTAPSSTRWSGATAVAGDHTFRKIAVGGEDDVCGLTTDGALYCWGPRFAQKAAGTQVVPARFGPPGTTFRDVSAGFLRTLAIASDGKVYYW